jgi:hypothetical protein
MTLVDRVSAPVDPQDDVPGSQSRRSRAALPDQLRSSSLRVIPWKDEVVDALGLDPRSMYVEQFWLPVIGPTCTLLLRRTAARLERHEDGYVMDVDETARSLGLGGRQGRNSPFARAIVRCTTFELARWQGPGILAVRRMVPPLARRLVLRLPVTLQGEHSRWIASSRRPAPSPSFDQHRDRARRLALGLVALGEAFDRIESRLLRLGVHPAVVGDALTWARRVRLPGDSATVGGESLAGEPRHGDGGSSAKGEAPQR